MTATKSFDPKDWDEFRQWGARASTDLANWYNNLSNEPCWRPMPPDAIARFNRDAPWQGEGFDAVYRDVFKDIAPYVFGNVHPRHWGWVNGSGVPVGAVADFLASGFNPNCALHHHSAMFVELESLRWLKTMLEYPQDASGLLVSGASIANLLGLTVARNAKAGWDIREEGLAEHPPLVFYASSETHSCVQKAVEMLGLGRRGYVRLPVDPEFRLDMDALRRRIAQDRAKGLEPIGVIANAGTVNTGAIDPLDAIADLCAKENLWLHVDGAFGALAWLDKRQRAKLSGMQRADSLAFDCHKWMYLPYDIACLCVRDAAAHKATFAMAPAYLSGVREGVAAGPINFADHGIELSRSFRALKLWMTLRVHGINMFAQNVANNLDQAQYLADLIRARPELELMAPVPLNVVCFRYRGKDLAESNLNRFNMQLLRTLQDTGAAMPSMTMLNGKFVIRAAIVNHRSKRSDFELLVEESVRIGDRLVGEG